MDGVLKEDLSVAISKIKDPRIDRHKKCPFSEIIFLVLFGALIGVENWRGIEMAGMRRLIF